MLINNFHVMGGEPDEKPMHFFGLGSKPAPWSRTAEIQENS
jgi:hypothetical protein